MLEKELKLKYKKLTEALKNAGPPVVAFSGGTDSSLLAFVCARLFGRKMLAVTACSETYTKTELSDAVSFARKYKIPHKIIRTSELGIKGFSKNPPNRCFYCKSELFGKLIAIATGKFTAGTVYDGANASDMDDFRPGIKAARKLGVRSPLMETGFAKDDIKRLSRHLKLPTWNKPACACLSSRIPYGEAITRPKLQKIERAEQVLNELGFTGLRVRTHNKIARIEVPLKDMKKILREESREFIIDKFKKLGYTYVTLDLEGFRSGSMNEVLRNK
ncbi:MAG: ATP-dependent sacrificial sulfur transferase LarE [Planctomycetes bacterium]|nr:ATP-dependent sacrificial sulfur transferase LarE [Planctomycetota bacterium]